MAGADGPVSACQRRLSHPSLRRTPAPSPPPAAPPEENPDVDWLPRTAIVSALALFAAGPAAADPAPAPPAFEKDVLPVFQSKCLRCHGEFKRRGALDLRNKAAIRKGGEGGPALAPGSAEQSPLGIKIAG